MLSWVENEKSFLTTEPDQMQHFAAARAVFEPKIMIFFLGHLCHVTLVPASVAQLDAPSDWRRGGRGFNPRRWQQHSFLEIDHEIFSTVILSLPLIQEGQLVSFWRKNVHNTG